MLHLHDFPSEIIRNVLSMLDGESLLAIGQVCRKFNEGVKEDCVWMDVEEYFAQSKKTYFGDDRFKSKYDQYRAYRMLQMVQKEQKDGENILAKMLGGCSGVRDLLPAVFPLECFASNEQLHSCAGNGTNRVGRKERCSKLTACVYKEKVIETFLDLVESEMLSMLGKASSIHVSSILGFPLEFSVVGPALLRMLESQRGKSTDCMNVRGTSTYSFGTSVNLGSVQKELEAATILLCRRAGIFCTSKGAFQTIKATLCNCIQELFTAALLEVVHSGYFSSNACCMLLHANPTRSTCYSPNCKAPIIGMRIVMPMGATDEKTAFHCRYVVMRPAQFMQAAKKMGFASHSVYLGCSDHIQQCWNLKEDDVDGEILDEEWNCAAFGTPLPGRWIQNPPSAFRWWLEPSMPVMVEMEGDSMKEIADSAFSESDGISGKDMVHAEENSIDDASMSSKDKELVAAELDSRRVYMHDSEFSEDEYYSDTFEFMDEGDY